MMYIMTQKIVQKISFILIVGVLLVAPFFNSVFAQLQPPTNPTPSTSPSTVNQAPSSNSGSPFSLNIKIQNPIKVSTVNDAVKLFMDIIMTIAIPIIVVLFIWAGFQFVFALGNKDKIAVAKRNLLYTLIGTLLVLGAWMIASAIIGTVNSILK